MKFYYKYKEKGNICMWSQTLEVLNPYDAIAKNNKIYSCKNNKWFYKFMYIWNKFKR